MAGTREFPGLKGSHVRYRGAGSGTADMTVFIIATAKAFFSDGHTSEICIYRRFEKHGKHGGKYELYMTVNLCEEYPDIEVTERFRYMSIFYDFDSDLTAEGNEPAAE